MPSRREIVRSELLGFFFLRTIGGVERLRRNQIRLSKDRDGDTVMHLAHAKSRTSQYNESEAKIPKSDNNQLRPAIMIGRRIIISSLIPKPTGQYPNLISDTGYHLRPD